MKRCPACDRTYSDEASLHFCLDDGAPLLHVESSSPNMQETLRIPSARETTQAHTEVLGPGARPTNQPVQPFSPMPRTAPHGLGVGSFGAPLQQRRRSAWPWIIGAFVVASVIIAAVAGLIIYKLVATPTIVVAKAGGGDYTTIAEAIRRARPGTRIMVRPGFYGEAIVIDKQLEIIGDGSLKDIVLESTDSSCITMKTDKATVRNLTLRGRTTSPAFAVDIPRGQLLIEDCDITSDTLACVAVHGSMADPIIRRTRLHDSKSGGVFIFDQGKGVVEDCEISGSTNAAIEIKDGSDTLVRRTKLHDNKASAIFIWKNSKGTVEDCDIYDNSYAGITVGEYASPTIRKTRIRNSRAGGIFFYTNSKGTVEDCEIRGTVYAGVEIKDNSEPTIRRTKISESKVSGIFVWRSSRGTIEDCEIFKNAYAGISVAEGADPVIRRCKINRNGYQAVWVYKNSAATVNDSNLTGNDRGPWLIENGSTVARSGNTE